MRSPIGGGAGVCARANQVADRSTAVSVAAKTNLGLRVTIVSSVRSAPAASRPGAGLQLDHVVVGIAEVERRPITVSAVALDDLPLDPDAARPQALGNGLEALAGDGQTDVIHAAPVRGRPLAVRGQQID